MLVKHDAMKVMKCAEMVQDSRDSSQEPVMFSSPFLSADLDDSWLSSLVAELLPEEGQSRNVSSAHSAAVLPQVSS